MPRHHLVPQFLLRNFANDHQQLRARSRDDLSNGHLTSVKYACNQIGFYRIEAEDLESWAREGHNPELVESVHAAVEGDAAIVIERLLAGTIPQTRQELFDLGLFVAIQSTRGWQFREDVNQAATQRMRAEMNARPDELISSAESFLRKRGERATPQRVAEFIESAYGDTGPKLIAPEPLLVQESIRQAVDALAPRLFSMIPRLYVFDEPSLVISDAPVAPWAARVERAVGIGNADLVFMPLSRTVALAYGRSTRRPIREGTPVRARQINRAVADGAIRWIYEHPQDDVARTIELPAGRPKWVTELVETVADQDERRELWQFIRR